MFRTALLNLFLTVILSVRGASAVELPNFLTLTAELPLSGAVKFRPPLPEAQGTPVVLFHGIYGGASHLAFRELLPLLDQSGAKVWIMDLVGAGQSAKPKMRYSIEKIDEFVREFLSIVVREPAVVVAESLTGSAVLQVSKTHPELFRRLILLSPTGTRTLGEAPTPREQALFERIYNDEEAGLSFYRNLLSEASVRFFLERSVYNPALITEERIAESVAARENLEQRWLTFSFVGKQIVRSFQEASTGVFVPAHLIFGRDARAVGYDPEGINRPEQFQAIRPDFEYSILPECGSSVQREKPEIVAQKILEFSR
jgi:pimeloyl-ACP methyl ester carboxylesterase